MINDEICYAIKDANSVYEIGQTRFKLHKLIYNHKTGIPSRSVQHSVFLNARFLAVAIEFMLIDALLAAEPILHIAEDVFNPQKFLHLTDHIMSRIEASDEPVSQSLQYSTGNNYFPIGTRGISRYYGPNTLSRPVYMCGP